MGNTISDLTPATLPPNTTATSFNRNGRYTVLSLLGHGQHGSVYRVTSPCSRLLAMKVLKTATPAQFLRFRQEASILCTLRHANIMALEDIGGIWDASTQCWDACIFTPLADQTLLHFYTEICSLNLKGIQESFASAVAWQMVNALQYLHAQDLIHKDVRPTNILVFRNVAGVTFKLSDFGIARWKHETGTDIPAAVARYTAPETLLCALPFTQACKADVWALGMVVKDMLTGALEHPHVERKELLSWAKQVMGWMLEEDVLRRPGAGECRESVWIRKGAHVAGIYLRVLRGEQEVMGPGREEDDEVMEM